MDRGHRLPGATDRRMSADGPGRALARCPGARWDRLMARYVLLVLPSANRVAASASAGLARAELDMVNRPVLGGRLSRPGQTTIGGVPYVPFGADRAGRQEFTCHRVARQRLARRPRPKLGR